jgi:hypothetical protein
MSANAFLGLFGCGLLGLAAVASGLRPLRLPAFARHALMLAAAIALIVPLGDLPLIAYVRGVTGDLSVSTLVLTCAVCFAQLTGKTLIGERDRRALCWLLALGAAFLYPFALGWTQFDPYALGYGSLEFVTALLIVTLLAWWAGRNLIVLVVLAAVIFYLAGAYESRNLWDYLIDAWSLSTRSPGCSQARRVKLRATPTEPPQMVLEWMAASQSL